MSLVAAIAGHGSTAAISTTGAKSIFALTSYNSGGFGIVDNKGNGYTLVAAQSDGIAVYGALYYCNNPVVSIGGAVDHTFHDSNGQSYPVLAVAAFTEELQASPVTGSAQSYVDAAPSAGTVTPTHGDQLLIAILQTATMNSTSPSITQGFTVDAHATAAGWGGAIAHLKQGSTPSSVNPVWTWTPGGSPGSYITAAFKTVASAPDSVAPVLSLPTGAATTTTTGTIGATTDEGNGTLYGVVTASATAPTGAQIRAGQDHLGASAVYAGNVGVVSPGAKSLNATGLVASTTYYGHLTQRDAAGNDSNVVSSASFATPAPGDVTAPTLSSPLGTTTGSTTASGGVTTSEANGILYAGVWPNATTPSVAQVKAGTGATYWTGGNAVVGLTPSVSANGLSANTAYRWHYVHRDAAGNDSALASSATFTTTPTGGGTVTTPTIKNNTATVQASLTGLVVHVSDSTGAHVVTKTGQTTNLSGVLAVTDPLIVVGAQYQLWLVNPGTGATGSTNLLTAT